MNRSDVSVVEDECEPIASLWLAARYEDSALSSLKPLAVDQALLQELIAFVSDLGEAEAHRDSTNRGRRGDTQ